MALMAALTEVDRLQVFASDNRKELDLIGGADADRTRDLLNAIQALSQTELQPHHGEIFQLIGYYPRCQPTSPAGRRRFAHSAAFSPRAAAFFVCGRRILSPKKLCFGGRAK